MQPTNSHTKIEAPVKPTKHYSSIPLRNLIYMAWRNVITKKLRSFLTVFGVVIGIGAIFFLVSFGLGLQKLVTQEVVGNESIKTIDVQSPNSKIIKLNHESVDKIKNLPHVSRVGSENSFPGSIKLQNSEVDTVTYGVDKTYQELSNFNVVAGRALKDQDDSSAAVLNLAAIKALGLKAEDPKAAVDKTFNLLIPLTNLDNHPKDINKEFKIVGVIDSGAGSEVYVPDYVFSLGGVDFYSQVKVVVDDKSHVIDVRKQIESLGFTTTSPIDTIDQINQIFKVFNIIMVSFGSVGMIVAILGMGNTLTISLLERTKEIGLMMALGGRRRDMRRLFVFEALLLSLVGAVIGIFCAVLLGGAVNFAMNSFAHRRGVSQSFDLFSHPLWLMGLMVIFMLAVGMLVVYLPARRAERINPIDALRRE